MGICDYICCCFCCQRKFEKSNQNKVNKDLKQLLSITPSKEPSIWSMTSNPLDVKTAEMTDFYTIPNDKYKTEEDVLKELGYRMDSFIDSGAFATVHRATHLASGLVVAIKKIFIPSELDEKSAKRRKNLLKDIKNELYIMQSIKHRHIVRLVFHFGIVCDNETTLYIVMQFAPKGNLSQMTDRFGPFSENTCKIWFAQILSALSCVHRRGVAHRDLKLSNILLDETNDVLISDFGLSRVVWRKSNQNEILLATTICGTPPYMSPELLRHFNSTDSSSDVDIGYDAQAVDVWALGVILFRLFNRDYPFPQIRRKALKNMNRKEWYFSSSVESQPSPQLKDLFLKIFEPNPKERPKLSELQKHKWIRDIFQDIDQKSLK